jgi:hypothetical protein
MVYDARLESIGDMQMNKRQETSAHFGAASFTVAVFESLLR